MTSRTLVALRITATPQRVFEAFTREIGQWWQPNLLFQFTHDRQGTLAIEPRLGGRLTETYADGEVFEIGTVRAWDPPTRLVFSWRQAGFAPGQVTEVQVRFEAVGHQTRVTVEHVGWDAAGARRAPRVSATGLPAPAGRVVAAAAHRAERADDRTDLSA